MDIKPVDVQMFVNKSSQINKNENMEQKWAEQYQLFSNHFQKTTKEQGKKTIETNKTEDEQINKDGKGKNQGENKQNKNGKEKNDKKHNRSKSSLFDVCI